MISPRGVFGAVCCALCSAFIAVAATSTADSGTKSKSASGSPLLRALSLHDRIAQIIVVRGYGDYPNSTDPEYRRFVHWLRDDRVGGFIVAGRIRDGNVISAQPFEMAAFINHMQRLARTPLLVASDFERGASMRVAETARFPYLMAFGAAHDLAAIRELGAATAHEARALGVTWIFAPDADVNNNPDNPIINTRSFGEDPQQVAADVSAFIEGAHTGGDSVLVTAKHFPGHGDTAEDSHIQMAKLDQPRERIEAVELVPFRAAVEHAVDAVMTAHMAVPAFEPDLPATLSPKVLTGLLREELGFKGLVVTDAMEMQGVASLYSQGEAAVRAVAAGADVLLMPTDPEACIRALMSAVEHGRISPRRIDESAARILNAKQRVGLLRTRLVNLDAITDGLEEQKLESLAQGVADRALTLVKDEAHLFPMPSVDGSCLVIMGERPFGQRGETLLNELQRRKPGFVSYVVNPSVSQAVLAAIIQDASKCKQIYLAAFVTVAANRASVALEATLNSFVSALVHGPVPVALIAFGSPYLLREFPNVSSYMATFSTATTSEKAAAKALVGEIRIGGKMPVSIPGLARLGDGLDVPAKASTASNGSE